MDYITTNNADLKFTLYVIRAMLSIYKGNNFRHDKFSLSVPMLERYTCCVFYPVEDHSTIICYCVLQIAKNGCGSQKGCYSEPTDCTDSSNCEFLVTYETKGENVTFEMSGKHGYVSIGFNSKQKMVR